MQGEDPGDRVDIVALDGTPLQIPIASVELLAHGVKVEIIKDAGDDPDITNGTSVFITFSFLTQEQLQPVYGQSILYKQILLRRGRALAMLPSGIKSGCRGTGYKSGTKAVGL